MSRTEKFTDILSKTTVANVVAAFVVCTGIIYAVYTKNTELVGILTGAGIGYLFKEVKS